ncbi:glycosyl transferase family 51 [Emticicia oligotrophica DSM 17448]|uniref:Glycosyl transferase family 51 n=1 Tax=Emticicia oligotrophica (strain DSM 17448 / CIP 109782 / MTCC 6937 / GPTSA100-15) TaxID=929562 RepID=A0ABN4AQ56_EMTOG|nr:transglycosylase domain-containing protein [Emticicia oligotrophica]AFK04356.1 glycosyl transferase family 51 [Emticicia oligotrophica DSM 17448]
MVDKLRNILESISTKTSNAWWWILDKIYLFLCKAFGKERVEKVFVKFNQQVDEARSYFVSKFDTDGNYYPIISKIYKITLKVVAGVLIYLFCIETNFLWLCGRMPSIEQLTNPKISQSSAIFTADGVEIGKFFTENRKTIDSAQMSPWLFKALIATEDKRFYEHSGIDLQSMAGVAVGIFKGGERGGGSTVSQQLAKNLYSTRKSEMKGLLYYIPVVKTLVYKTKEWLTAIRLERNFTKGEILTMYLNTVDYGNNAYGIRTAAKTYFNKEPINLLPEEAAILVGLQKGTTLYNPIRNPKNALKRRNTVLQLMASNGSLSQDEADKLSKTEIKLDVNMEDASDGQGNYFKVALAKFIENWAKTNEVDLDLYRDGLKIYTTIDSRMQTHAETAVSSHMKRLQKIFDQEWKGRNPWTYENGQEIPGFLDTVAKRTPMYKRLVKKFKNNPDSVHYYMYEKKKPVKVFSWEGEKELMLSPVDSINYYKRFLQTGMMAMDPYTGFIKAWVGGINYDYFKYDHVKQGRRQPGSTFKPILYTAAIDGPLNLSPCDRRTDQPFKKEWVENGEPKVWEPKNADGVFTYSEMTLRRAIARSVNSVAAQLADEVGPRTIVNYARKMGITAPLEPVLSLGIGTSDVSLYEMVAAYGIFLNEGQYTEPMLVFKIEDAKGKVLFEFETKHREAIKAESAYLMQYMLRGGVEEPGGTSQGLFEYCSALFGNAGQAAGKTGTTSNYSDAWYIGFTKDLICGVWVGGDDRSIHFRSRMGEGSRSALPIFGKFMQSVYTDKKLGYSPGPFPKPGIKITKEYQGCVSIGGIDAEGDSTALMGDSSSIIENVERLPSVEPIKRDTTIDNR